MQFKTSSGWKDVQLMSFPYPDKPWYDGQTFTVTTK